MSKTSEYEAARRLAESLWPRPHRLKSVYNHGSAGTDGSLTVGQEERLKIYVGGSGEITLSAGDAIRMARWILEHFSDEAPR